MESEGGKVFGKREKEKVCSLSLETFVQEHYISPLRIIVIWALQYLGNEMDEMTLTSRLGMSFVLSML